MAKQIEEVLYWDVVYTWATSKDPEADVGESNNPWGCPLACCFYDLTRSSVEVTPSAILTSQGKFTPKAWMKKAMKLIDTFQAEKIPAKDFILVLEEVKVEDHDAPKSA